MRKILTMLAALIMALGLMSPVYAVNTEYTYTETSEYVYLKEGATLYISPDGTSSVYGTVSASLASEQVEIIEVCNETGSMCFNHNGVYVWISPDDVTADAPETTSEDAELDSGESSTWKDKVAEFNWLALCFVLGLSATIFALKRKESLLQILAYWIAIAGLYLVLPLTEAVSVELAAGNWVVGIAVLVWCLALFFSAV